MFYCEEEYKEITGVNVRGSTIIIHIPKTTHLHLLFTTNSSGIIMKKKIESKW